jgi:hypothetical protein
VYRLKTREILEAKKILLETQKFLCLICNLDLKRVESRDIVLDHDHISGEVRAVLCRSCNANMGRVWHWAVRSKRTMSVTEWLLACIEYVEFHENNPRGVKHPKHRTELEKRELRNKKARKRRKKKNEEDTFSGEEG